MPTSVFISYRRSTSKYPALLVYKALSQNGCDVFIDYESIDSGKFAQVILNQIAARGHFIVILSPGCLNRTVNPGDWLRKEIEYAIENQRNIVPLLFDNFSFKEEERFFTGKLAALPDYNALSVPDGYFDEAMVKLQTRFLKQPVRGALRSVPKSDLSMVQEAVQNADKAVDSQIKPASVAKYIQNTTTPSHPELSPKVEEFLSKWQNELKKYLVPTRETLGFDPIVGETIIASGYALRAFPIFSRHPDVHGTLILTNKRLIFKAESENDTYALDRKDLPRKRTAQSASDGYELNFAAGFAQPTHRFWISDSELYNAINKELKLEWLYSSEDYE